jgi:hypothetical protein
MVLMANPLVVGVLALMATTITFLWWIITEPIVSSLIEISSGNVIDQAVPLINTISVEFYALPVGITIALWIWAFLAVTKRQVVTQPY